MTQARPIHYTIHSKCTSQVTAYLCGMRKFNIVFTKVRIEPHPASVFSLGILGYILFP
jgi:hypothetical protein